MGTVTLKLHHVHHYTKLRETRDDEEIAITTLTPEGQQVVDPLVFQLHLLDQRVAQTGMPEAETRTRLENEIRAAQKGHTKHWSNVRQHVVAYSSDDGKYHLGVEVSRAEAEEPPETLTIEVP